MFNEAPRSKLRGITELNFEDFSEAEANPVASYGECSSSKVRELVNLQNVAGKAKPYQVQQLLEIVERYNLQLDDDEES